MGRILHMSMSIRVSSLPHWRCTIISWAGVLILRRMQNSLTVGGIWYISPLGPCCLPRIDVIKQVIRYAYTALRHKSCNKVARDSGGVCDLQGRSVLWWALTSVLYFVYTHYQHPQAGDTCVLHRLLEEAWCLRCFDSTKVTPVRVVFAS